MHMSTKSFRSHVLPTPTASLSYFVLVFSCAFALGAIRIPLLLPRLGVRYAELLEAPFMFISIIRVAGFINERFHLKQTTCQLGVGFLTLAFTVGAEYYRERWLMERRGRQRSLSAYLKTRDAFAGSVFAGLLLSFAVMPAILGSQRKDTSHRD